MGWDQILSYEKPNDLLWPSARLGGRHTDFGTNAFSDQDNPRVVPNEYASTQNPIEADDFALEVGKELYSQHCTSCHGKEGLGDGPKAEQSDTPSGDFADESVEKQSDGALFYKTRTDRDDMPEFKKKILDKRMSGVLYTISNPSNNRTIRQHLFPFNLPKLNFLSHTRYILKHRSPGIK